MHTAQPNVFLGRDDTFFGVCEALGEDFGFNPLFLRVAFALGVFFNPLASVIAYFAAGLVVGLSRLIWPNPRIRKDPPAAAGAAPEPTEAQDQMELALAA